MHADSFTLSVLNSNFSTDTGIFLNFIGLASNVLIELDNSTLFSPSGAFILVLDNMVNMTLSFSQMLILGIVSVSTSEDFLHNSLDFRKCTFLPVEGVDYNNSAISLSFPALNSFSQDVNISVSDSFFRGFRTSAIYISCENSTNINIMIDNTTFEENLASKSGGALYLLLPPDPQKSPICNTGFRQYNYTNLVTISGCSFTSNSAPDPLGSGGAIYMLNGYLSISFSQFVNNTARLVGGTIYLDSGSSALNVTQSNFSVSCATNDAGQLLYSSSQGPISAQNISTASFAQPGTVSCSIARVDSGIILWLFNFSAFFYFVDLFGSI